MTKAKDFFPDLSASALKALRENLGLSQAQFATVLGFKDGGRTVRAWECGHREGYTFKPTGTATAAIHYVTALHAAADALGRGCQTEALKILDGALVPLAAVVK